MDYYKEYLFEKIVQLGGFIVPYSCGFIAADGICLYGSESSSLMPSADDTDKAAELTNYYNIIMENLIEIRLTIQKVLKFYDL